MLKRTAKPENAQPAAKRKLTRAERKQIEAIIRQAKGDGKPHTVQDSIPFRNLYPDGLCRLDDRLFSKTIAYEDVNYRLAGPDDQRDIFERLCDFYNGYDPSIGVQMTLSSSHKAGGGDLFRMAAQGDDLDGIRAEASGILQTQYERGSNGYVKRKYVTLTIEAESVQAARARFSRIEADTLNRFKVRWGLHPLQPPMFYAWYTIFPPAKRPPALPTISGPPQLFCDILRFPVCILPPCTPAFPIYHRYLYHILYWYQSCSKR